MSALSLPLVFRDHMVLQRDLKLPVWGKAPAGKKVSVSIAGQSASAVADAHGKWKVTLAPLSAGGPHEMRIAVDGGEQIVYRDVLVGEVWVGSGQSNMEWVLTNSNNAEAEIAAAKYPNIRMMTIERTVAAKPEDDAPGRAWKPCTPEVARDFSAVAYFFGRRIHQTLGVPIGLIHSSWGGSIAEAWTDKETLASSPILKPILDRFVEGIKDLPAAREQYQKELADFNAKHLHHDPGNKGFDNGWANADHNISDWDEMKLPTYWETTGLNIDGAVWFRRDVEIPAGWVGKDLKLSLGCADDFDDSYFNGVMVGHTGNEVANPHAVRRVYPVPAKLVKAGKNTIAVRVFDHFGNGGLCGPAEVMTLAPADGSGQAISLVGKWKYKVELELKPINISSPWPAEPIDEKSMNAPAGLYNGMINPLIPYGIRGAIWYQGESNGGRGEQYRTLLPAMIECWREAWGQGPFAFFIVQLANWMSRVDEPGDAEWAELREAQTLTAMQPHNGLAVAIDIGDAADIHPRNKQDVGLRLALAAEAQVYGKKTLYSGPMYDRMSKEGKSIRLHFKHVNGGLLARGGSLKGFAVAGEDKKFVWAEAKIDGDSVLVSSDKIAHPVAVRYAWANNPECNLYNKADLPAVPFRTDDWAMLSAGKR